MKAEPATILVVILGGTAFFFLVLPLAVTLANLPAIWQANPGVGLVLGVVVVLTGFFFLLFFGGLVALTFSGG